MNTLVGKHIVGYQSWFYTPRDGAGQGWGHWFRPGLPPIAENAAFDLWPDVSELSDAELEATMMLLSDGKPAHLFSNFNPRTARRHFEWMARAGIDGASLGRFVSGTSDPETRARLDKVLDHVRRGAEAAGRCWFIWYDVTGSNPPTLVADLQTDVMQLDDRLHSMNYLHHRGKPLVGIWGAGETSMPGSQSDWQAIVDFLKPRATLLLGGPRNWQADQIMAQADVVSPWAVTAFGDLAGADVYRRDVLKPDLALTRSRGQDYLPVLWPGFSARNQHQGASPMNAVPRLGGRFYWRQVFNCLSVGCTMLFTAMFDEADEGTAIWKTVTNQQDCPQ